MKVEKSFQTLTPAVAASISARDYIKPGWLGKLTVDPIAPVAGDFWYNLTSKVYKAYDGTSIQVVWPEIPHEVVAAVNTNYTVLDLDTLILCNADYPMMVTLMGATGSNKILAVKNIGSGLVTVNAGLSTIDGETNQVVPRWSCMEIMDYASGKWAII